MDDLDDMVACPLCATEQAWEEALLGVLGSKYHFRCIACGGQWCATPEEAQEECS